MKTVSFDLNATFRFYFKQRDSLFFSAEETNNMNL